jgi:hypothetical protein
VKAYIDQLNRDKGISAEHARAVVDAFGRADKVRSPKDKAAPAVATDLDKLAGQLESDASTASSPDAARLKSLAGLLKDRSAKLH